MSLKVIDKIVIGVFVVSLMAVVSISLLCMDDKRGSTVVNRRLGKRRQQEEEGRISVRDGKMFQVLEELKHDKNHFTQGLTYSKKDGILYESNGLYGRSKVCQLNPDTGITRQCVEMEQKYFAEGMQVYKDSSGEEKLIQLTWKSQKGFIRNINTLQVIQEFEFTTTKNEGWGIAYNDIQHEFIVSDGSPFLHIWDAHTLKQTRKVQVTRQNGGKADNLNELEFVNGHILANVWYQDVILVIHPETGECLHEYGTYIHPSIPNITTTGSHPLYFCFCLKKKKDFSMLYPYNDRKRQNADVLNGISISDEEDVLYITGKFWDRMFKVKLLNKPPPTPSPTPPPTPSQEDANNDQIVIIQPSPGSVSNNQSNMEKLSTKENNYYKNDDSLGNDDLVYDTVNIIENNDTTLLNDTIINDLLDGTELYHGDDELANVNTNLGNDTTTNTTATTPLDPDSVNDDTTTTENVTQHVDTIGNLTIPDQDIASNTTIGDDTISGNDDDIASNSTSDDTLDDDDISVGNTTILTNNSTLGDETFNENNKEEITDSNSDHVVSLDDIAKQIDEKKKSILPLDNNHSTTMNLTDFIEEETKSLEKNITSSENGTRF